MSQNLNRPKETRRVLRTNPALLEDETLEDALIQVSPRTPKWAIWIAEDAAIYSRMKRPNAWRRFWTWAFFGWRWTPVAPTAAKQGSDNA